MKGIVPEKERERKRGIEEQRFVKCGGDHVVLASTE
ncbi:unnamed protein product [Chrysoparadoxa australica]